MAAIQENESNDQSDGVIRSRFGKKTKNWADDERVRTRIKNEIIPLVTFIRDRRSDLNDQWRKMFKVWSLEHEDQGYDGRSNVYMPSGRRAAETTVGQLVSATFPGDDNFGVEARNPEWAEAANGVKEVLRYLIDRVARVRVGADKFYRQLAITGNSPVKIHWMKKTIPAIKRSRVDSGIPTDSVQTLYDGPVFEVLDASNVYFYPENCDDPRDATVVFEDLTVAVGELKRKAFKGVYNKGAVEVACAGARSSTKNNNDQGKLEGQGINSPQDLQKAGAQGGIDVTELYLDFDPRADSWESERDPVPFLITIANGEVLRAIPIPAWHGRHPYLLGRMGIVPNRLYGSGTIEAIRNLVLLLNDQVNQGMDAATFAINPITLANPNLILGTLPDIEPGVQWLVNDVNQAVKMFTPPGEVINNASILTAQTQSWIMEGSGAPAVLTGGSSPGRAFKTATGIGRADQNAKVPLQEIVRLTEAEVWEPMLSMFHSLAEQHADVDFLLYMSGGTSPMRVAPAALAGDWMFRWLASTQTDNKAVKGSQLMEMLTILTNPAMMQALMQNGVRVNPAPLIKRLYEEVHGFRDVDKVLMQQGLNAMGGQIQGGAGQVPEFDGSSGVAEPGALEPGLEDNGAFQDMRQGADAIAGSFGNLPFGGVDIDG